MVSAEETANIDEEDTETIDVFEEEPTHVEKVEKANVEVRPVSSIKVIFEDRMDSKEPITSFSAEKKNNPKKFVREQLVPDFLIRPSQAKTTNLDHLLEKIGSFGLYQKLQFLLVGFLAILPSMVAYSYVFVSATPQFTCRTAQETVLYRIDEYQNPRHILDDYDESLLAQMNPAKSEYFVENRRYIQIISDEYIEKNKHKIKLDSKCEIKEEDLVRYSKALLNRHKLRTNKSRIVKSSLKCVEWYFDDALYGQTTVTAWDLVCVRSYMKAGSQNAFILGTGCSVFTGILSDKFGRRTALILMITLMFLVLNITQLFVQSSALTINQKFSIFAVSRFFQGVAQTMYSIGFVLLLEITGPKHRVTAGNILAYSFSIGQMVVAGLGYWFRDWRKIQWTLAIYVMPFFLYYWLVPESPRWLLSSGKVRDTFKVLKKITRVNRWTSHAKKMIKRKQHQTVICFFLVFNDDGSNNYFI